MLSRDCDKSVFMTSMMTSERKACDVFIGGEFSKREGVLFHVRDRSVQNGTEITAVLPRYKPKTNIKTTLHLLEIGFKGCFIKFSFHFEGVLLAVRGCTCMLRGCSRTLKTPNSPPLDVLISPYETDYKRSFKKVLTCFQRHEMPAFLCE